MFHPVSRVTLNVSEGEGIGSGLISDIPSGNALVAEPNEDGRIVFTFEQDRETGGKDYYDFAMDSATLDLNISPNTENSFTTYLTKVTGQYAEELSEGSTDVIEFEHLNEYGKVDFDGENWILTPNPDYKPQTFQTPGTFTLETEIEDEHGNPHVFEVLLVITEAE
ncbi:hypothetical protein [Metabacillus fastidiosus]|uniref:hypothetical protein n=1 Tax=Metabacillus fastidiosus TaxID=1458 RepID=UPI002E1FAF1E|nr:hypothetical protein [Metabacillus fastidiosus]